MNIFSLIKEETSGLTEKTAVIDGNYSVSYGQLISLSEKIAATLKDSGVRPCDRVALLCSDSIDYIATSLAVLSISAVVVPIAVEQSRTETVNIMDEMMADFIIFERGLIDYENTYPLCSEDLITKELFIRCLNNKKRPNSEYYAIKPAFIRFSSGTTGSSKGVILSHESILDRTTAADKGLCVKTDDVIFWMLSMSFHFVVTILLFLRRGATIILCGSRFPEDIVEALGRYSGTFIYASPFHYNMLTRMGSVASDALKHVRLAVSTAMKLPADVADNFFRKFGFHLSEAYGIIEVGLPFINFVSESKKTGSVGRVLPDYEIAVLNRSDDGSGEIHIKGKGMLDAYYSPWESREDVLHDGWFNTGDIGVIDDDGFLTIVGRSKDIINFAGMKVFPYEVEAVINQFPGIKESYVYGESHSGYGQLPMARISLKDDAEVSLDELKKFCYKKLSQYKVPKGFEIVNEISKTASGKITR